MSQSSAAVIGQLKHTLLQDMLMVLGKGGTDVLRKGNASVELVESIVSKVLARKRLAILGAQMTEDMVGV